MSLENQEVDQQNQEQLRELKKDLEDLEIYYVDYKKSLMDEIAKLGEKLRTCTACGSTGLKYEKDMWETSHLRCQRKYCNAWNL